jgi:hypothetical protein
MAIDTAKKRRAASGVPFVPLGIGVTPDATKPAAWRRQSGWSYRAEADAILVTSLGGMAGVMPYFGGSVGLIEGFSGEVGLEPLLRGSSGLQTLLDGETGLERYNE